MLYKRAVTLSRFFHGLYICNNLNICKISTSNEFKTLGIIAIENATHSRPVFPTQDLLSKFFIKPSNCYVMSCSISECQNSKTIIQHKARKQHI